MTRRLVLVDGYRNNWATLARQAAASDSFDVVLLHADEQSYRALFAADLRRLDCRVVKMDQITPAAELRMREEVPALYARLPAECDPQREFGESWWLLEAAEKSVHRGQAITSLYTLAVLREALSRGRYDELWVDQLDPLIGDAVASSESRPPVVFVGVTGPAGCRPNWARYWRHAAGEFGTCLVLAALTARSRRRAVRSAPFLFFTVYPQWWLEPHSNRRRDRFFPPLRSAQAQYVCWVGFGVRSAWRNRLSLAERARHWTILQAQVRLSSAMQIFSIRAFARARHFWNRAATRLSATFAGFPVSRILLRDIGAALCGADLPRNRLIYLAVRRVAEGEARAIVFRDECQPVDRAVQLAVRARLSAIGLRHSALDRNYLPFHSARGEIAASLARAPGAVPMPDAIIAPGPACVRVALEQGYPSDRVFWCGPSRHHELASYRESRRGREAARRLVGLPAAARVVLVATSVSRLESESLLTSLSSTSAARDVTVIVRLHPAGGVSREVVDRLRSLNWRICPDGAMYEHLECADVVVTPGSTIAFDAISLGVMPIAYEWRATFSALSLKDFADCCFVATDATELDQALASVFADDEATQQRRAHWPDALKAVFGDFSDDLETALMSAVTAAADRGLVNASRARH